MSKKFWGFILSLILVVGVILQPLKIQATEAVEISQYRNEDGDHSAPEKAGYIFGGWYTDTTYETAIPTTQMSGTAYPKWVKESVFNVKCQVTAGTTASSETTAIRFVTAVDSLKYSEVRFVLNIDGQDSNPLTSTKAYTSIKALVAGETKTYAPNIFDDTATYFCVYGMNGFPQSIFEKDIKVTPLWKTLDGTLVSGTSKTFKISDAYTDQTIVNDDGTVVLQNRDYNNYVSYTYNTAVKAGDWYKVKVTLSEADSQGTWIGVFGVQDGSETQIYADNTTGTSYTVNYQSAGNYEALKVLVKNFNVIDWGNVTVTLSDFDVATNSFAEGIGFESWANVKAFSKGNYGTLTTVSYEDAGITPLNETFGNTALKAVNSSANHWPYINITLDKEYAAGSILRVWIYAQSDVATTSNTYWSEFWTSDNSDYVSEPGKPFNKWVIYEVTLTRATNVAVLRLNTDNSGLSNYAITVYLDNFQITENPTYSFGEGITFEKAGEKAGFAKNDDYKSIALVSYDSAGIEPLNDSFGEVALLGDNSNGNLYPRVNITLDTTYPAGTVFSAWVYVQSDVATDSNKYLLQSWARESSTDTFTIQNQAGNKFNEWVYYEVVLDKDATLEHLRVDVSTSGLSSKACKVYMDNFQISQCSFAEGVSFENPADFYAFSKGNYGTLTTVSYEDAGITPLNETFGNTALKAVNSSANHWPYINITLDKKYAAGSVFQVWIYAQSDVATTSNTYWSEFWTSDNSDYVSESGKQFNEWVLYEVTLTRESNVAVLRLNTDYSGLSDYAITVYMDNFQMVEGMQSGGSNGVEDSDEYENYE